MKKIIISIAVFFYCLCTFALTENEGVSYILNYYHLISEYATAENITLARTIEGLHVGSGYVYPDVEINLGKVTETEGVGIKTVYLASIMSRQNLLLKFVPKDISLESNSNGICTMVYTLYVYSGNEQPGRDVLKYSVPLKMEIQNNNKKIRSILKRTKSSPPQNTLSISSSDLSFDASGGTRTITVNSNRDWSISVNTASWGHLTRNGNTLTLRVDSYSGSTDRTDYFKIKAGDKEERINIKQSAPNNNNIKPSAQINSITVSQNQDINGKSGIIIHVSFNVHNMNGKNGRVSAYFYDNDGNALIDINDSYCTTTGNKVSTGKNITPKYDNTRYDDLQLKIPYSELHQSGTYSRTIKISVSIWDYSVSPHKKIQSSSYTTFTYTPSVEASFLVPSETSISVPSTGGTRTITVSCDGDWNIGVGTASWIDLSKSGNIITLNIKKNNGNNSRNDYFTIKSGTIEKKITINQSGNDNVVINRVWVNHNVTRTGYNSVYSQYLGWQQVPYSYYVMQIHVDFNVKNMKGKNIRVCAFFYDEDGVKMKSSNNQYKAPDGQVTVQRTDDATYDNTHWSDFVLEIPNSVLKKGDNKFQIEIQDSSGNSLCRFEYIHFTH